MASKAYILAKEFELEQRINHETPTRKTRNNTPAFFYFKKIDPQWPAEKVWILQWILSRIVRGRRRK
jgi:hypothetical protein